MAEKQQYLKETGKENYPLFCFVLFICYPHAFFEKVCACDLSKSSNPVFPLHPKQFKQFEKRVNLKVHLKSIYVYI